MLYRTAMAAPDRAYDFAKPRILDGRFPGGELITEGDVAAATGLSRTPVREAFARLASEGLLKIYPKRGALVVPVSATEVETVLETRLLVEQFAIQKVITHDIDLGSAPHEAIAKQAEFAAEESYRCFVEADHEFHRTFVAATDNSIMLQLHDSMRDRQHRMGLEALHRDHSRTPEALDEHRKLLEAVEAQDADAARAILDKHIGTTLALLRGPVLAARVTAAQR